MKQVRSLLILILMLMVLVYSPASAHEGRRVGDYTIEIGWREEPAYTSLMNGPEITITRHGGQEEHDEAEATLKLKVNIPMRVATIMLRKTQVS